MRQLMMAAMLLLGLSFVACDARTSAGGDVFDDNGKPLAGASVGLKMIASGRTAEMTTSEDGAFSVSLIHGPFAGRFELVVSKGGYGDYRQEVTAKTSRTLKISLMRNPDTPV